MHFPHPAAPAWVCCLRTLSRSLPRLSCVFSRWGFRVCLLLFLSCSWACLSASAFQSPALFSEQRSPWFRFAGPSLPPSLSFGGGGAGGVCDAARWCPSLRRPRPEPPPPAGVSVECPPSTPESRGGVSLLRGSLLRRSFPASLPSSAAGVASRRVARRRRLRAELGRLGGRRGGVPGGRRQPPVLGTFESLVGSHLAAACILSLPSGASARPPSGGL